MKKLLPSALVAALLAAGTSTSPGVVVVLSDLVPADPGGALESFLNDNFTNVTEIRHANYSNFAAAATQDAINGTGAFSGSGAADVVIVGRSLSSGDYSGGNSTGYNALGIPMVSLTAYISRSLGTRLGWHTGSASHGPSVAGAESTVTAAGAGILGIVGGTYDLVANSPGDTFNGMAIGTTGYGDGEILATIGSDTLAAYWDAGDAPGDPATAGVATFSAPRLLFNLDNDPNSGNNGVNDLANLTPEGLAALRSAIDFATPLTAVPEPSSALLLFAAASGAALRRRR